MRSYGGIHVSIGGIEVRRERGIEVRRERGHTRTILGAAIEVTLFGCLRDLRGVGSRSSLRAGSPRCGLGGVVGPMLRHP
jgi:hypothetical protein